jgi:predicted metal-binding transcription factor (methanogenesis marker protein 9)
MNENIYYCLDEPIENVFKRIDACGGWRAGATHLITHCCKIKQPCYFSKIAVHNDYNTTICSADEYYWWKISNEGQAQIRMKIVEETKQRIIYLIKQA